MATETNRREFVQSAGLAAPLLLATAGPIAAAPAERAARATPRTMGARFRDLMNGGEPLICPGAYDLMSARLCEIHGFRAVFVGSSSPNQELLGMPDRTPVQERRYARLHRLLSERIPPAGAETKLERRSQQLVQAVLDIDFAGEQHDEQRRKLFEKVSAVAQSMGWLELAGDRPAEPR